MTTPARDPLERRTDADGSRSPLSIVGVFVTTFDNTVVNVALPHGSA